MKEEAILIFTFSPIQPFIAEARRPNDMYTGSRILVNLARAAGQVVEMQLVYPPKLTYDMPNRIVAKVPWGEVEDLAGKMTNALLDKWKVLAEGAKAEFSKLGAKNPDVQPDSLWNSIWARQIDPEGYWEIYWSAAKIDGTYPEAYLKADRALAAVKRTRRFKPSEEQGVKDSLSGVRSALRTQALDAKKYWAAVSGMTTAAELRPDGREVLDAFGVIKRFNAIAKTPVNPYLGFPSTSSIASIPFLESVVQNTPDKVKWYRKKLEELFDSDPQNKGRLFRVRDRNDPWPYDGDFFYPETLELENLAKEYHLEHPDSQKLKQAQTGLADLRKNQSPSPYYAIVVLDGDSMGEKVNQCLLTSDPEKAHNKFSELISKFAEQAGNMILYPRGLMIYNGGDDVLAFAPIDQVVEIAGELAAAFTRITGELANVYPNLKAGTVSAGIAIVHHRYPLAAALRAARDAEHDAKYAHPEKNMLSVRLLKRSGAPLKMFGNWYPVSANVREMIHRFSSQSGQSPEPFSSRLAYDLDSIARVFPEADYAFQSELRRQANRHKVDKDFDARSWSDYFLYPWARALPEPEKENAVPPRPRNLVNWLLLARFIAQGGQE